MPAVKSIESPFFSRPAPRSIAAIPTALASRPATVPFWVLRSTAVYAGEPNFCGSSNTEGFPPWAATKRRNIASAEPFLKEAANFSLASANSFANPQRTSSSAPSSIVSIVKSLGPSPFSVAIASSTSRWLPTAKPNGWSMAVMSATVFLPKAWPIATISSASLRASCSSRIKAPLPAFTSSTMYCAPAAIFLLITEEAINGMQSTVAVTSRKA